MLKCYVLATLQGSLEGVEGNSLLGLPSAVQVIELRMPLLRILVLDGVHMEGGAYIDAPHLAMLSWRGGEWSAMPLSLDGIPETAVLDLQDCSNLETLPDDLQARGACKEHLLPRSTAAPCACCMPAAQLLLSVFLRCLVRRRWACVVLACPASVLCHPF